MPIIVPQSMERDPLFNHLEQEGALLIDEEGAETQDIRPARIGILNLMPAASMQETEAQWLRYMSNTVLQVEPVLIKFDDDSRELEGASRTEILSRYTAFSKVVDKGLDGLIVTGDNLEIKETPSGRQLFDYTKVKHSRPLEEVIEWARKNVHSTIYSCWGAHYAMGHLYGLERELTAQKTFGVYRHSIDEERSDITQGMDDEISAPHSRWGNIRPEHFGSVAIRLLAVNEDIGWLLAEDDNEARGTDLFIQGHPEYGRMDLHNEYDRDKYSNQAIPKNYYSNDNPQESPKLSWANDARVLHANWIRGIYRSFA